MTKALDYIGAKEIPKKPHKSRGRSPRDGIVRLGPFSVRLLPSTLEALRGPLKSKYGLGTAIDTAVAICESNGWQG